MNMEEDGRQSYGNKGKLFLEWFCFCLISEFCLLLESDKETKLEA